MRRPRAAIVVTGTELVRGDRNDLNGPFYAREATALGLEPERITVVGDDPAELEAALREAMHADLCLVSGGLGPTHDDRTVELVAKVAGRRLVVDRELEAEIEQVSRSYAVRLKRPYADFSGGVTKQATLPETAVHVGIAGTAPGIVLDAGGCVFVILPGPPSELRRLWPNVLETDAVRAVLARTEKPQRRVLRFHGVSESAVARTLEELGGDGDGVEVTICARDFELHVDLVVERGAEARADAIAAGLRTRAEEYYFSDDERPVQQIVLDLCRERGLTLATAESCTGGMVAARLTEVPGSSDVFRGGIVAYADGVKAAELDVPEELISAHGAVSAEVARAMARGACERLGVDVAVAVTGIAGPGGGSDGKPVGLVYFHAVAPDGEQARELNLPGDREWIRSLSTAAALHLVRALLERSRNSSA